KGRGSRSTMPQDPGHQLIEVDPVARGCTVEKPQSLKPQQDACLPTQELELCSLYI
ncbi:Hypothetical predicted protein, partial [Scomber scombrus]